MNDIYRQKVLDRWRQPHYKGLLTEPTISVAETNPLCGDAVSLALQLDEHQRIQQVAWQGEGCAISLAAADFLSEKIVGMTMAEVKALTDQDMLSLLGIDLGPARLKCATLSLMAIKGG